MSQPQAAFLKRPASSTSLKSAPPDDSRYQDDSVRMDKSLVAKFSLPVDPSLWNTTNVPEADDELHKPDPRRDLINDSGTIFTIRALINLGCLAILLVGLLVLFGGYPLISFLTTKKPDTAEGLNAVLGANSSGLVPEIPGMRGLIDPDTPKEVYTRKSYVDGTDMQLIWSDEFNKDGRTFYPGDDPYWEAVDLHYWQTNNLEWYDPKSLITKDGSLVITLAEDKIHQNHDLNYTGGMMSTWNSMCFTGGLVEASVILPGSNNAAGLWPAIWTMGNLGRAGYGASLEGMWPYTYDACDVGTVNNQSFGGQPDISGFAGDKNNEGHFSYLPGQRLSRCTCPGESHPGPIHSDGSYVGRSAPEIDIFEATMQGSDPKQGAVSQSGQYAPFNAHWEAFNQSDIWVIPDPSITVQNTYTGGVWQQAISSVTLTNQQCYELEGQCYSTYGIEYKPGYKQDDAYITWITDDKIAWTLNAAITAEDTRVQIQSRPVPQEPMYLIANLGISPNFGGIDWDLLKFPAHMYVDYIRVYQHPDRINYGCDPEDFPTKAYIDMYEDAYKNPLLTTWGGDYKQPMPKNKWKGEC